MVKKGKEMLNFRAFSKLTNKLIFCFLIVALVPLIGMGAFNYGKSKEAGQGAQMSVKNSPQALTFSLFARVWWSVPPKILGSGRVIEYNKE